MGLAIALSLGLIVLLAVGRGSEVQAQGLPVPPQDNLPSPEQLERKRLLIQKAFLLALQKRIAYMTAQRVSESQKEATNNVAQYFRSKGIDLAAPNAEADFWNMPEPQLARILSATVNNYLPVGVGPAKIAGTFPTYYN